MHKIIINKLFENEKLLDHLYEQSYYIKTLNRDPSSFNDFERQMKIIYKERISDKVNNIMDGVEMISSIIDTL